MSISVTRTVPLPLRPRDRREGYDWLHQARQEKVLEYCRIPRSREELSQEFNIGKIYLVQKVLHPLITQGKLKLLLPDKPTSMNQRWLRSDIEIRQEWYPEKRVYKYPYVLKGNAACVAYQLRRKEQTEKRKSTLLDFCKTPKTRQEIAEYLDLKIGTIRAYINSLVGSNQLRMMMPDKRTSILQAFVVADSDVPTLTTEDILEFLQVPRSRSEIAKRYKVAQYLMSAQLKKMVDKGMIKLTNLITPQNKEQRFVVSKADVKILTNEAILEYCIEPRSSGEITDYFNCVNRKAMFNYLLNLIRAGKLQYTVQENTRSRDQKYKTVI